MSQNYAIFLFIGVIFLAILGSTTYLTALGALKDASLFGQVVVAEIAAVAGLLAPSPFSLGKQPAP